MMSINITSTYHTAATLECFGPSYWLVAAHFGLRRLKPGKRTPHHVNRDHLRLRSASLRSEVDIYAGPYPEVVWAMSDRTIVVIDVSFRWLTCTRQ